MASAYRFWLRVLGRMVRPRADRMPTVSTSAGRTPRSARSMAAVRSTASAVRSVPLRSSSRSSSNRAVTKAVSAGLPVAVISLPRTWMSALNSRSITCRSSSPDPSRLTMEWSAGITIFTWDRGSPWPPGLRRSSLPEARGSSFRISVNSSSIRRSPRPGGPPRWGSCSPCYPARLSGGPGEGTAAEHVGVDVRHGLARLRAGVEDHPVSLAADALGHRYLVSLANDLVQQAGVGRRERGDVRVVLLRDDEHVRRRLRVDVPEREHPVGSQDPGGGDRLGGDSAEQAFRHTKILGPQRYA